MLGKRRNFNINHLQTNWDLFGNRSAERRAHTVGVIDTHCNILYIRKIESGSETSTNMFSKHKLMHQQRPPGWFQLYAVQYGPMSAHLRSRWMLKTEPTFANDGPHMGARPMNVHEPLMGRRI